MKHNILSLFLGLGVWSGLLASPTALYAQEDMSAYDIDIDLTVDNIDSIEVNESGQDFRYLKFNNKEYSFTETTGCVTGDGFLRIFPRSAAASSSLPVITTGYNVWAGTYDIYVVMVPEYYRTGVAPSESTADDVMKNKVRVEVAYRETLTANRDRTQRSEVFVYEGTKVDTILAFQDFEFPLTYYKSYREMCPTINVCGSANRNDTQRNNYTNTLYVDRVILKAKSVTPGKTVLEGSCGENVTYKLDTQTGTLTFSGSGELREFPVLEEYATSDIAQIVVGEGITGLGEDLFKGMKIDKISLPGSLKSIGKGAFQNATLPDLTLPASLEVIGDYAFSNSSVTKSDIELPEGVKSIGSYAFRGGDTRANDTEEYIHVTLPGSLESVGDGAFARLPLMEVIIPAGIKTLGDDLFRNTRLHRVWWNVRAMEMDVENCDPFRSVRSQIDTLYIGENVEVLPNGLCESMQVADIVIPGNVQTIGARCFAGVPMSSVNIPASVKSIGDYAFTTAQEFNVAEGNTAYTAVDGVLFSKDMTELVCYPHARIASYRIPDGVKVISGWAFGDKSLTNVNVPASVGSLSLDVFASVRTLTVAWKTAAELPKLTFSAETYPMFVQVPYGSKDVYLQADGWKNCTIVNEIVVGNALAEKPNFSLFRQMMEATGWNKALQAIEDEEYARLYNEGKIYHTRSYGTVGEGNLPAHRYYGFTVLAERNTVYEALLGKAADAITLQDLTTELAKHYEGKTDEDYASADHVLNRFVSYHLLPVKLPTDKLVIHYNENGYDYTNPESTPTIPITEYYETMGEGRRLMKMTESNISNGVRINRFMQIDRQTGYEIAASGVEGIAINKEDSENASYLNGYMYALDELLVYSDEVRDRLGSERMRYDVAALMPELANNDFRRAMYNVFNSGWQDNLGVPNNYPYFENLTIKGDVSAAYLIAYGMGWKNYQGDEFNISGIYDVTIKLPAVPRDGVYELRMANQSQGSMRGIAQVYFGSDKESLEPCGLPADLNANGSSAGLSGIGWMQDTDDEVVNQLNDLQLREKGYMKGPKAYHAGFSNSSLARDDQYTLRRIIGQFPMKAGETYYLRFKTCLNNPSWELYMDYIELVPQSVYDNPNEPEDRW